MNDRIVNKCKKEEKCDSLKTQQPSQFRLISAVFSDLYTYHKENGVKKEYLSKFASFKLLFWYSQEYCVLLLIDSSHNRS